MKFSQNLRQIRKSKKLSQLMLAKKLNIVQGCVGNWEIGIRDPSLKQFMKLCEVLEVEPNELLK